MNKKCCTKAKSKGEGNSAGSIDESETTCRVTRMESEPFIQSTPFEASEDAYAFVCAFLCVWQSS